MQEADFFSPTLQKNRVNGKKTSLTNCLMEMKGYTGHAGGKFPN